MNKKSAFIVVRELFKNMVWLRGFRDTNVMDAANNFWEGIELIAINYGQNIPKGSKPIPNLPKDIIALLKPYKGSLTVLRLKLKERNVEGWLY